MYLNREHTNYKNHYMKKTNFPQKIIIYLLLTFSIQISYGQSVSYSVSGQPDTYSFQIDSLTTSDSDAYYSHFWWFGDNGFCFTEKPNYVYQDWASDGSVTRHLFTAPTENYGTGGPPPMADTIIPTSGAYPIQNVLQQGEFIKLQRYRNAVIDDTLYLIITYSAPNNINFPVAGELTLTIDPTTDIISSYAGSHHEFLPNGEQYTQSKLIRFTNLLKDEERSVLIPIIVNDHAEEIVKFRVDMKYSGEEIPPPNQGVNYDVIQVLVADSHDPNKMIEYSKAKDNCNFGGEAIIYTVEFQNDGDTTTQFIRITSFLDEKLDMNSIRNITSPKEYGGVPIQEKTLIGHNQSGTGAIYQIDKAKHTITFEFHDLILRSTQDERCHNLDRTRSNVVFTINMKPNYQFGPPVVSVSSIVFDQNDPIITDSVFTTCLKPNSSGGFYPQESSTLIAKIKKHWIIYSLISLSIIFILILLLRKKRNIKHKTP